MGCKPIGLSHPVIRLFKSVPRGVGDEREESAMIDARAVESTRSRSVFVSRARGGFCTGNRLNTNSYRYRVPVRGARVGAHAAQVFALLDGRDVQ